MKCKHEYIPLKDGSLDKYCIKCDKKFMQAANYLSSANELSPSLAQPIMRETIRINMGGHIGSADVYKDELAKEINSSFTKQFDICMPPIKK